MDIARFIVIRVHGRPRQFGVLFHNAYQLMSHRHQAGSG
jgi:hypothetical protein